MILSAPKTSSTDAGLAVLRSYRRPLPWRYVVPRALVLWLATRLLDVALTVLFAVGRTPLMVVGHTPTGRVWHWYFWDAWWYVHIAYAGYAQADPRQAGFFPLYPLLAHLLDPTANRTAALVSALVIANLATLAALVAVGLLAARERRDPPAALAPMLLLAVSPLAVFLGGAYSDSLFLALAAWALLAARRGAWTWAALAAALAVATRPFGLALVPALLVEYASQHAWPWRLRIRAFALPKWQTVRRVALLVLAPVATLSAFLAVLWHQYGDPLASLHVEGRSFGHAFLWPWQTLVLALQQVAAVQPHWSYPTAHMLLDLLPLLACLGTLAVCARRWPASFTLYTALGLLLCLTSPVLHASGQYAVISDGRYCYAFVPVLLQMGTWAQQWPRWCVALLLGISLVLQGVLTVFMLRGGWLV